MFFRSRNDTALDILALRQQLILLKRKRPRPRLNPLDRLFWIALRHIGSRWAEVLVAVKPDTVSSAGTGQDFASSGSGIHEQAPADRKLRLKFGRSSAAWPKRIRPGERPGSMENFRSWVSSFPNEP